MSFVDESTSTVVDGVHQADLDPEVTEVDLRDDRTRRDPNADGSTHVDRRPNGHRRRARRAPDWVLRRFTDVEWFASGSQCALFRARDGDREVAVKVYDDDTVDADLLRRWQALGSPHLAEILDFGDVDGVGFEVLEWLGGGTLADRVGPRRDGAAAGSSDDEARRFVLGMVDALEVLHEAGIRHRDIKPSNIGFRDGEPDSPVLFDPGVAVASDHTQVGGQLGGTPDYAPPEAAVGVTRSAWDYWSLGMVTALLVQGFHPLERNDVRGRLVAIYRGDLDLSGITDERWSLLVRGLLTHSDLHRWGHREVREWLAGGSPEVHAAVAGTIGGADVVPFEFRGREVEHPTALADQFAVHWDDALRVLANRESRDQLARWLARFPNVSSTAAVEAAALASDLDDALIYVIAAMAATTADLEPGPRTIRPMIRGVNVTRAGLRRLCPAAIVAAPRAEADGDDAGPGDADAQLAWTVARSLVEGRLAALADATGHDQLRSLHRSFAEATPLLDATALRLDPVPSAEERAVWSIQLLRALCDPTGALRLRDEAVHAVRRRRDLRHLVGADASPAEHIAAIALANGTESSRDRWVRRAREAIVAVGHALSDLRTSAVRQTPVN